MDGVRVFQSRRRRRPYGFGGSRARAASGAVAVSCLLAAFIEARFGVAFIQQGRGGNLQRSTGSAAGRLARPALANDEATRLQEQARKAREEAAKEQAALDESLADRRKTERQEWLAELDADGTGKITAEVLTRKLPPLLGYTALDEDIVAKLLATMFQADADGQLSLQELEPEALRQALARLLQEANTNSREREESERATTELMSLATERSSACLPYLLPIVVHLDAECTGSPEAVRPTTWAEDNPWQAELYLFFQWLQDGFFFYWWAPWAACLLLTFLARETIFPQLVRFSLMQALMLNALAFIPTWIGILAVSYGMDGGYTDLRLPLFYVLVVCTVYAFASNFSGNRPDRIPVVSQLASEFLGPGP
eukprot:TRINITY_DN13179_c0_g1_i1.p1 TRINITY_DN13179_c0_g1~~TRINITY_DN13179_c0_g1_i1.p1  ORF type:complete len:369 (-),score=47.88 TRINITY_DN13179_c0_g1_i1:247-1353(-)